MSGSIQLARRTQSTGVGRKWRQRIRRSRLPSRQSRVDTAPTRLMTTSASHTSPEEAGRQARKMAQQKQTFPFTDMSTLLAHAGLVSSVDNAAMSPPLHLASTYARPPDGPYHEGDSKYTRMDNPTRLLLEKTVGRLECHGGSAQDPPDEVMSCAFASGMSAVSSIIMAHTAPITVLLPADLYHGVSTVLMDVLNRFQVKCTHVDFADSSSTQEAIVAAGSSDVIVWMETPSNPLCQVIDIEQVCHRVQQFSLPHQNVTTVVDSTLAPPCLTQPLRHGADLVMHSATKYLGGHSDVLVGVVTASPWTIRGRLMGPILRQVQESMGAVAAPLDSWLTMRGLRSLHVRVERQCQTAMRLARHLVAKPPSIVRVVHYPGLEAHAQHQAAKKQMTNGFGGVLSVEFESEAFAMAVAGALSIVQRATSLGGTETLVEHRASIEPQGRVTSPVGLLRVSVGLEGGDDLIRDFDQAIAIAEKVVLS